MFYLSNKNLLNTEHIKMAVKSIKIKNHAYFFLNSMVIPKKVYSNLLKLHKKSYKNIGSYYIGYITLEKLMIIQIFIVEILFNL